MSTGWKWIRDDGEEFHSQVRAAASLRERPGSTFVFSELSMAGEKRTDATDKLRVYAWKRGWLGQRPLDPLYADEGEGGDGAS